MAATDTIPKVDKVGYLFASLMAVGEGSSLDEIRLRLVEFRRELDRETGKDLRAELRPRARLLDNPRPDTFSSNARDAMRELMRLGMVVKQSLPNDSKEFERFRDSRYHVTPEGERFIALGEHDSWQFRDRFFCAMYAAHPYLRSLYGRLAGADLYIPRVPRSAIPGDVELWRKRPPEPLRALSQFVCSAVEEAHAPKLDVQKVARILRVHLDKTWSRRAPSGSTKEVGRWVVKMINDQVVRAIAAANNLNMDYIAFRHTVSLMSDLHVCWETKALTDRPEGWTIWLTAEGDPNAEYDDVRTRRSPAKLALDTIPWIKRRSHDTQQVSKNDISRALMTALLEDSNKLGGFSQIHEIRARVCHGLKIHGWTFDYVLRELFEETLTKPSGFEHYSLHFDAGGGDRLPHRRNRSARAILRTIC